MEGFGDALRESLQGVLDGVAAAGSWIAQSWQVESSDPVGDYEIRLHLDGKPTAQFRFELKEPLALGQRSGVATAPGSLPQGGRDCTPRSQCCKVCSKGQACGNSCISASYTCRKGRGCACNAAEVCR